MTLFRSLCAILLTMCLGVSTIFAVDERDQSKPPIQAAEPSQPYGPDDYYQKAVELEKLGSGSWPSLYGQAAKEGHREAQVICWTNQQVRDCVGEDQAWKYLEEAANSNYTEALYLLGKSLIPRLYPNKQALEKFREYDYSKYSKLEKRSFSLIQKAACGGHLGAQLELTAIKRRYIETRGSTVCYKNDETQYLNELLQLFALLNTQYAELVPVQADLLITTYADVEEFFYTNCKPWEAAYTLKQILSCEFRDPKGMDALLSCRDMWLRPIKVLSIKYLRGMDGTSNLTQQERRFYIEDIAREEAEKLRPAHEFLAKTEQLMIEVVDTPGVMISSLKVHDFPYDSPTSDNAVVCLYDGYLSVGRKAVKTIWKYHAFMKGFDAELAKITEPMRLEITSLKAKITKERQKLKVEQITAIQAATMADQTQGPYSDDEEREDREDQARKNFESQKSQYELYKATLSREIESINGRIQELLSVKDLFRDLIKNTVDLRDKIFGRLITDPAHQLELLAE